MTNNNKPRPGSMLAKEQKENTVMLVVLAAVTLIVGLVVFTGGNDLHKFSKRAGIIPNIIGALCFVGSWVWLYFGAKNEWDGKAIIGWIILLVAGLLISCGFQFSYFGL